MANEIVELRERIEKAKNCLQFQEIDYGKMMIQRTLEILE